MKKFLIYIIVILILLIIAGITYCTVKNHVVENVTNAVTKAGSVINHLQKDTITIKSDSTTLKFKK